MRKALTMLGALAVLAIGSLFAAPASAQTHGTVTCAQYTHPQALYPADGAHFKICFNNWTLQKVNSFIFAAGGFPTNVTNLIKGKGTVYYYFKNRADMVTWMSGEYGASSPHVNSTATCGYTGYSFAPGSQTITVAIFDECSILGATVPNPDMRKVIHHEAGHAFDYSLAAGKLTNRGTPPSASTGYRQLVDDDKFNLSGIAMCTLFQGTPSDYERQLGATPGAVCSGGTVNPGYTDQLTTATAKAPYFVNQTNALRFGELFAQQFSILAGGVGGSQNNFRVTDNIVGDNRFECTFTVVQAYWNTLIPPGPSNITGYKTLPSQCTQVSENDLK